MLRRLSAAFVLLTLLTTARSSPAATEFYAIDPAHAAVVFSAIHSGFSITYGFFRDVSGTYILDDANPENNRFQLIIKTNSLDTNHAKRDEHLRSNDFFNVQTFPEIRFDSTRCVPVSSQDGSTVYQVTGNLKMHGVTKQITIPALRMIGRGTGPYGDQRTGFVCQIEIKRSDFGMTTWLDKNMVSDAIGVTVSFEGGLQAQPAAAGTGTAAPAARP